MIPKRSVSVKNSKPSFTRKVAVAPGPFFGPAGEGYVRISITAATEHIRAAMERVREFGQVPELAERPPGE